MNKSSKGEDEAYRIAAEMCPTCGLQNNNYCLDPFHSTTNAPTPSDAAPVAVIQANADAHCHHWAGKSDDYWLQRLMQEVGELASVLAGDHPDTVEHELTQIGGIAVDWLRRLAHPEDAPGTTLQYDVKNKLSYVWLIWVLHEQTDRWELQGVCTSEAELTPRVRAIKNDPNTIHVRTEVAFVDHLFAAGETVGDYANRLYAQEKRRTTADAPPEVTEEMVTAGLKATERWGVAKFQRKPTGSVPPYMVFEVGEHPRTFIEDILCAALAVAQKEG